MRPVSSLRLFTWIVSAALPIAAQVATLQVTDVSAPDSPIHISGSVIVAESIESSPRCATVHASRCSVLSEQDRLNLLNISHQPIVAFVSSLVGSTPNGNSLGATSQQERIFGSFFAPGENAPWWGDGGIRIRPQSRGIEPTAPKAEARIVFVQFADGTTFGDVKAGEQMLLLRQQSLESLAQLDAIYATQGEQAFIQAAQRPGAGGMMGMMGIAQMEKQDGAAATISHIRRMLATAKERLAVMSAQSGR